MNYQYQGKELCINMLVKKAEYVISATSKKNFPNHNLIEFVFLGRSNVGKSSFINALTNRKNLAYTSSKPGKTITLNYYKVNEEMMFVDVPGYGYATKQKTERLAFGRMIEDFLDNNEKLKMAFLVVDIRHEPSEDDCLMYQYLKHYQIPLTIIATKADKIGRTLIERHLKVIKKTLELNENDQILAVSSETKYGFLAVENIINNLLTSKQSS